MIDVSHEDNTTGIKRYVHQVFFVQWSFGVFSARFNNLQVAPEAAFQFCKGQKISRQFNSTLCQIIDHMQLVNCLPPTDIGGMSFPQEIGCDKTSAMLR